MHISEPHAPKNGGKYGGNKDAFRKAINAMDVGVAITITSDPDVPVRGNFRTNISSRAISIGKQYHPVRRFTTAIMGDHEVQITRIE